MLIRFPGDIPLERLPDELLPWAEMFRSEGITHVHDLYLSVEAWRGDRRCQVRCNKNPINIREFTFDLTFENGVPMRVMRPGVHLSERPLDMDYNPLAIWAGHDD